MTFVPTTIDGLISTIAGLLSGATDAGTRVYTPRDWPTRKEQYPMILIELAHEVKDGISRNSAPEFTTTGTLSIAARVTAPAAPNNGGAVVARAAAWRMKRQIEIALINAAPLMGQLQRIPRVEARVKASAEGEQHDAELLIALGLEWYEGAESFAPPVITDFAGLDVSVDLQNVFDPTGTYVPDFPYPVQPAPRTSGPDGRDEGPRLVINLPS